MGRGCRIARLEIFSIAMVRRVGAGGSFRGICLVHSALCCCLLLRGPGVSSCGSLVRSSHLGWFHSGALVREKHRCSAGCARHCELELSRSRVDESVEAVCGFDVAACSQGVIGGRVRTTKVVKSRRIDEEHRRRVVKAAKMTRKETVDDETERGNSDNSIFLVLSSRPE